ncbi:BTB/POZ and MATH domain-containing protein 2-like [Carex rostrata]
MDSSAQAISHQNLETTSAIRTVTITGTHLFKIYDYSLTKGIGIGKSIDSNVFIVGGYNWIIEFYPDGYTKNDQHFLSIFVRLVSNVSDVKARPTFTILQQNGSPSDMSLASPVRTFDFVRTSGFTQFAKRTEFEASKYLKDDAFTVKCAVTVIKGTKLEVTNPYGVVVPPSNLNQNLASILESGKGADVTFIVKGERFKAHPLILAARSAVFNAELFGCMKEKCTDIIPVHDIEVPVFKSMLYFIYSDLVPDFEGTSYDDGENQDPSLMAQHLLVAADRYQLQRLRMICEDLLCKRLCVSNAGTTLLLANQHNCSQLKAECLKFMSSPEVFKAVARTDGFYNLIKIFPSILKDI